MKILLKVSHWGWGCHSPLTFENLITDARMTPNDLSGLIVFKNFYGEMFLIENHIKGVSHQKNFSDTCFLDGIDIAIRGDYSNDDEIVISWVCAVTITYFNK